MALLSVLVGSALYIGAARSKVSERTASLIAWARHGFGLATLMTGLASIYLAFFFVQRHYEIDYVYHNSSAELPLMFRLSAFWSGQEGSFLLWAIWTGLIGLVLVRKAGRHETAIMPFYGLVYAFLLGMVVAVKPFAATGGMRTDGQGLNPLLQDYWMAIHPPTLFLGYALMAVPFVFAMGALARREYREWVRPAAPWAIGAATVLALALSMGGHWAYRTLGWGGFWGWDPVENASFVPLLCGLALLHGLFLQRGAKAPAQRTNIGLAITGFVAVMYASYLTRSGVLTEFSNHSFSALPHAWLLLAGLIGFTGLGYGLFLWRFRGIPNPPAFDSFTSREFGFGLSVVILMIAAVLVAVGTSTPLITGWTGKPSTVQPAFYNQTMAPLGFLMTLMLAIYPIAARDGLPWSTLKKRLWLPLLLALAAGIAAAVTAKGQMAPASVAAAVGLAFGGTLALTLNVAAAWRIGRSSGLVSVGGYLSHVGFGVLLVGIVCSSLYSRTERVRVEMNDKARAFGYQLRLLNRGVEVAPTRTQIQIRVSPAGGANPGLLSPAAFTLHPSMARDRSGNQMTAPGIHSTLSHDVYMAPVEFDPGSWESMPITLKPGGEAFQMGPLRIFFMGIEEIGQQGAMNWGVRAFLHVQRGKEMISVAPEINFQTQRGTIETLPGGSRINVDPNTGFDGSMLFDLMGPNSRQRDPYAVVDVTMKPLIWVVWLGMILTVVGGLLSVVRRLRDNRRRAAEGMDIAAPLPSEAATHR
jgi:cytochrome c-type biogenesis protein CcmF